MLDDVLSMKFNGKLPVRTPDPEQEMLEGRMRDWGLDPYSQADREAYAESMAEVDADSSFVPHGLPAVVITGVDELTGLSRKVLGQ